MTVVHGTKPFVRDLEPEQKLRLAEIEAEIKGLEAGIRLAQGVADHGNRFVAMETGSEKLAHWHAAQECMNRLVVQAGAAGMIHGLQWSIDNLKSEICKCGSPDANTDRNGNPTPCEECREKDGTYCSKCGDECTPERSRSLDGYVSDCCKVAIAHDRALLSWMSDEDAADSIEDWDWFDAMIEDLRQTATSVS